MSDSEGPRLPSEKELSELSYEAQVAFAARCALRVFPLIGSEGHFEFFEYDSERVVGAIWGDILWATLQGTLGSTEVHSNVTLGYYYLDEAESITQSPAKDAVDVARYVLTILEERVFHEQVVTSAYSAIASSGGIDPKDFVVSLWNDFHRLESGESPDWNFFQSPLFDGNSVSQDQILTSEVSKAFESVGAFSILEMWISFFYGEASLEGCEAWLVDWRRRYDSTDEESFSGQDESVRSKSSVDFDSADTDTTGSDSLPRLAPSGIPAGDADRPAGKDALGRDHLVKSLANMFSYEKQGTPITLGLFGHWGSGKSTVMKLLQKELSSSETKHKYPDFDFLFGWFNAWEYEHTDDIRAGLAQEVVNGLLNDGQYDEDEQHYSKRISWYQKVLMQFQYLLTEKRWESLGLFFKTLVVIVSGFLGFGGVVASSSDSLREVILFSFSGDAEQGDPVSGFAMRHEVSPDEEPEDPNVFSDVLAAILEFLKDPGAGGQILGAGAIAFSAFLGIRWLPDAKRLWDHPLATDLGTFFKLPSYREELGQIPVIRKQLEGLCKIRLSDKLETPDRWEKGVYKLCKMLGQKSAERPKRLVVFIDDLDRCQTEKIAETFDAARLIADIPGVILVIGIDERIAFKAMGLTYEDYETSDGEGVARDYLGKIIQVPVRLKSPTSEELRGFVEGKLFTEEVPQQISEKRPQGRETRENVDTAETRPDSDERVDLNTGSAGSEATKPSEDVQPVEQAKDAPEDITQAIKSSEAEKAREERGLMVETAKERAHFLALCHIFNFTNPRRLLRLKNTYRLLKALLAREGVAHMDSESQESRLNLLRMLFWLEFRLKSTDKQVMRWIESPLETNEATLSKEYATFEEAFQKPVLVDKKWRFDTASDKRTTAYRKGVELQALEEFTWSCLLPYPSREQEEADDNDNAMG